MEVGFDTTGWQLKTARVKHAFAETAQRVLMAAAQEIYDKTGEKLKGPHYGYHTGPRGGYVPSYPKMGSMKGKVPIPHLTGTLARSLKLTPISTLAWAIWCDPRIADYAKYVHDGTKKMKPRRFLKDTMDERRPAVVGRMQRELTLAIRRAGG